MSKNARKDATEMVKEDREVDDTGTKETPLNASKAPASSNPLANPAPLGLMGFGMTTVLLNLFNAGLIKSSALGMIFGMGVFYGGIAQVIAGVMEFKKGNTFGTLAFTSYGFFWMVFVFFKLLGKWSLVGPVDATSAGCFLMVWGVFTLYMFIGTLKKNVALRVVFGSLTLLFFLLAIGDFTENKNITKIAGFEGLLCGASAIYLACAEVLNETYGKTILPIG